MSSRHGLDVVEMTGMSDYWQNFIKVFKEKDLFMIQLSLGTPKPYSYRYLRVFDKFTDTFVKEVDCPSNDFDADGRCFVPSKYLEFIIPRMYTSSFC